MNSENEKLREALADLVCLAKDCIENITDDEYAVIVRAEDALTQQVEPVPAQDDRVAVYRDAELYGIGFMVDGVRVHPSRVTVQYSATRPRRQSRIRWNKKPSGSALRRSCLKTAQVSSILQ